MNIVREKTEKLPKIAAEKLATFFEPDVPSLLLLSGGSAFSVLDFAESVLDNKNLVVGMVDDRAIADKTKNNFSNLLLTSFGKKMLEKKIPVIDSCLMEKESPTQLARRFADSLLRWRRNNPKGKIIATLGIGEDGHTAGIFPFPESPNFSKDIFEDEEWVACYDASKKNPVPIRVTVTHTFLRQEVDSAIVFVSGESKKKALDAVLAETGNLATVPARILREMKNAVVFTDLG